MLQYHNKHFSKLRNKLYYIDKDITDNLTLSKPIYQIDELYNFF